MKSAKRFLLLGIVIMLLSAVLPLLMMFAPQGGGTGIIGGAGAPTYWFYVYSVLDGWPVYGFLVGAILLIVASVLFIRARKRA